MNRILADVWAFGTQFKRSYVGAFFALAFPIILILLFGSIFSGSGSSTVPLYVQDLDNTPTSHSFIAALNATKVLEYHSVPRDVAIEDYIHSNLINTALKIPAGFQDVVDRSRAPGSSANATVTLYGDPTQSSYGLAFAAVSGATTQFNYNIRGVQPVVVPRAQTIATQNLKYIDFFLPGMIGFTILTSPMFGMTSVCADYRTRKFFKFLATTTLTKGEWLISKVIFYSLLMLLSLAFMFTLSITVFGGHATLTPVAVLFVLAGTLEFTSLGMVLGLFVRDTQTAEVISNAIGFPMMFLAGSFFPLDAMPPFLQSVARALPLTYINQGLRATMVYGNDAMALNYLLITLVLAAVLFAIPAKGLSWKSK